MGMKNPFRRRGDSKTAQPEGEAVMDAMRPWWAWGPLGLVWFGSHHGGSTIDSGHAHHPGDVGHINHTHDVGGGFDGGAGGF